MGKNNHYQEQSETGKEKVKLNLDFGPLYALEEALKWIGKSLWICDAKKLLLL